MYRIEKVLNHNTVIAVSSEDTKEYLLMGKGIGFGKKVAQRIQVRPEDSIYSLSKMTERGSAKKLAVAVSPICLEIADEILKEAEKSFGKIDRKILFPMADHLEYAIKRIQSGTQISNPLTEDIRVLFHAEYKAAGCVEEILKRRMNIQIDEHEIGYIALHIHSAIEDEHVSQAMQIARAVRSCISLVESETGRTIDVMSLSYNRLMNHIRYMVARAITGELLKVNMNDYMEVKFPQAFAIARSVCDQVSLMLKCTLNEAEIGYLAMHIERVNDDADPS